MIIGFFISSMNMGGAERATANLANYLSAHGQTIYIYTIDSDKSAYDLEPTISLVRLYECRNNTNLIDKLRYNKELVHRLKKAVKRDSCNALMVAGSGNVHQALLAKTSKLKVIGMERTNPLLAYGKIRRSIYKLAYRFSDGYIFQTNGVKDLYGKKGMVISNPVSFSPAEVPISFRQNKRFCAVGRLSAVKNYRHMIMMFQKVHSYDEDVRLDIFGEGNQRSELQTLIDDIGASDYINLCGNKKNISEILTDYPFYIICSVYEGMPNALLEAMACGCISFSTDFNYGPSELIENGINGFLLQTGNVDALVSAYKNIVEENADLQKISDNATRLIATEHSMDFIGNQYLKYIEKIVE